jgi:large subunit ribosomal protein L1
MLLGKHILRRTLGAIPRCAHASSAAAIDPLSGPGAPAQEAPLRAPFRPDIAVQYVRALSKAKFDESVDIVVRLGLDPRKPNQSVRGVLKLPHGTGKQVRIAVFARGDAAAAASEAGAHVVGAEDLVESILGGKLDFDRCIASPDMMPLVGKVARVLGPRGLMPNPKIGTVTTDVAGAVRDAAGGSVEFRTEKAGAVHSMIGKVSFSDEALLENMRAFMIAINDAKPSGAKGQYLKGVSIASTMGPGLHLELPFIDPANRRFMRFDA